MNPSIYFVLFLVLFLVFWQQSQQKKALLYRQITSKKKRKEDAIMLELAKRFIGKQCLINAFDTQITGTIKEVTDGAVLIDNGKGMEVINLDFIVRIREYPQTKSGKKKRLIIE